MSEPWKKHLRKLLSIRAGGRCEYCRILEYLSNFDFHIEHIIGLQHGGSSLTTNLAFACSWCNWKKGPNISSILVPDNKLISLFNPRTQNWFDHFEVTSSGWLIEKTDVGAVTLKLLELNHSERVVERIEMMKNGFYP